jgi:hypothetical protein
MASMFGTYRCVIIYVGEFLAHCSWLSTSAHYFLVDASSKYVSWEQHSSKQGLGTRCEIGEQLSVSIFLHCFYPEATRRRLAVDIQQPPIRKMLHPSPQHSTSPSSSSTSPPSSSYPLAHSKPGPYASSIASTTLPSTFFPPSPSSPRLPAISTTFLPSATRTLVSTFNPLSTRAFTRASSLNHFSSASDVRGWFIVKSWRRREFARDSRSNCRFWTVERRVWWWGDLVWRVVIVVVVEESFERWV